MATQRQVWQAPADAWGPLPPHATPRRRPSIARWLELPLLVLGFLCLGYYAYASAETLLYQAYENRELESILESRSTHARVSGTAPRHELAPGERVGRIEIPRLRISAIIKAGSDARTLQLAVGHIPGTALPGERGNVGLAGHRDTFFRRLQNIRPDDEIRVTTPEHVFNYRVVRTDVVEPNDVWVLEPTDYSALTLVTCYPFTYVGSAPQRFIVRAQLAVPRDQELTERSGKSGR
jgi:sortase A